MKRGEMLSRTLLLVAGLEILGIGLRYLVQVGIARLAGATNYGEFTYALTWAQTLAVVAGLGLSGVAIRYIPEYAARHDWGNLRGLLRWSRLLTLAASIGISLAAVTFLLVSGWASSWSAMFIGMAAIPLLASVNLQAEALRGAGRIYISRGIPNIVQPVLVLGGLALFMGISQAEKLSAEQALLLFLAAIAVAIGLQGLGLRIVFPALKQVPAVFCGVREWFSLGMQRLVVKGSQLILNNSDIIVVGLLLGPLSAGVYAAAAKSAVLASIVGQATNLAVPPMVARSRSLEQHRAVEATLRSAAKIAFLPSAALAAGLMIFSGPVMGVFGDEFQFGSTALVVLAAGRLITAWTGPVGAVLNVTGHQKVNIRTYGWAAGLQVAMLFALVPPLGILGAALASSGAMIFWNVVLYFAVMQRLRVRLWPLPLRSIGS